MRELIVPVLGVAENASIGRNHVIFSCVLNYPLNQYMLKSWVFPQPH